MVPFTKTRDVSLLGRYARCDGANLLDDEQMSGVRLAVSTTIRESSTWTSRNGTFIEGKPAARVIKAASGAEINADPLALG